MDAAQRELCQRLAQNLADLKELYQSLWAVLRAENSLLISADLENLTLNNQQKDELIQKIRLADLVRQKLAQDLGRALDLDSESPRLAELAAHLPEPEKKLMIAFYGDLQGLVTATSQLNRDNAELATGALRVLDGALNEIKGTIAGKQTYGGRGKYKIGPETTGNFVSKEA